MKTNPYPILEDALHQIRLALIKLQAAQKELTELQGRLIFEGEAVLNFDSEVQKESAVAS